MIVALPLWFPWVGRAISARFGVRYAAYHRAGYGQFVLQEVTFTNAAVRFQAQKVESVIPTAWLWRRWRGQDSVTFLRVENWKLNVVEHKNP